MRYHDDNLALFGLNDRHSSVILPTDTQCGYVLYKAKQSACICVCISVCVWVCGRHVPDWREEASSCCKHACTTFPPGKARCGKSGPIVKLWERFPPLKGSSSSSSDCEAGKAIDSRTVSLSLSLFLLSFSFPFSSLSLSLSPHFLFPFLLSLSLFLVSLSLALCLEIIFQGSTSPASIRQNNFGLKDDRCKACPKAVLKTF